MFLSLVTRLVIAGTVTLSPAAVTRLEATPKCGFETPVQTLKRATMTFTGRALEVTDTGQTQTVRLAVTKSWKGVRSKSVTLINGIDPEGPFFRQGGTYLVFAWLREGAIETGRCSGTVDIASARRSIRELNRWQARHRKSRV